MFRYQIGLSAGSSSFGVDAALVRVDGHGLDMRLHLEQFHHLAYSKDLGELIRRVRTVNVPELRHVAALHRVLGETYALAVRHVLEKTRLPPNQLYSIGCRGHELWHDSDGRYPATLTLGMASVVAERTGLTTISDFCDRDLAVGGQGAPITALVDALLFHQPNERRALLHLGSVASLTALPTELGVHWRGVIGFEVAPCTALLDGVMGLLTADRELFDAGGKHAVQGRCLEPLLQRWLTDSCIQRRPPKCVSLRDFGPDFLARALEQARRLQGDLRDVLCTAAHFIVRAACHALQTYLPARPGRLLLSGRGARNGFLLHLLEQNLPGITIETTDTHGVPAEARQAMAYAGLAAFVLDGTPINLPSVTGALGPRLLGQITPGATVNWARCLQWMARRLTPVQVAAA